MQYEQIEPLTKAITIYCNLDQSSKRYYSKLIGSQTTLSNEDFERLLRLKYKSLPVVAKEIIDELNFEVE